MSKNFLKFAGLAAVAGAAAAVTYAFIKDNKQKEVIYECGDCCFGDCYDTEPVLTEEDRAAAEQAFDEIEAREKVAEDSAESQKQTEA